MEKETDTTLKPFFFVYILIHSNTSSLSILPAIVLKQSKFQFEILYLEIGNFVVERLL